jgi:hypothetical protein
VQTLSVLQMSDGHTAALEWDGGRLYFALHADGADQACLADEYMVEVATLEDQANPPLEAGVFESAWTDRLYILAGDHSFRSHSQGKSWESLY